MEGCTLLLFFHHCGSNLSKNGSARQEDDATRVENPTDDAASRASVPFSTIPIIAPKVSWKGPCAAILLQLAVSAILVVFAFVGVWFQRNTHPQPPIPTATHVVYVTSITILATVVSSFTAGQIWTLWLLGVLKGPSSGPFTPYKGRQATNLVGHASRDDMAETWPITITFLVTPLITTAVVAEVSISNDTSKCHEYGDIWSILRTNSR
jgi:hypothetical protein